MNSSQKYVTSNSIINIIWELIRSENFWTQPQKLWGWEPEIFLI